MIRYRIIYQNSNIEAPPGRFEIGRSVECNLVLDDPSVSRLHASIIRNDAGLFLEDRGSRNGCALNGKRVTGTVPLTNGDEITIGHQSIHISAVDLAEVHASAKNTMGLKACAKCGNWMTLEESFCRICHPERLSRLDDSEDISPESSPSGTETRVPTIQSNQMLIGLARKALSKKKFDETSHLLRSLMEMFLKKAQSGHSVSDDELAELTDVVIALAVEEHKGEHISAMFAFYHRMQRLIPRKSVEALYQDIRRTGYRTCPEMTRYLSALAELSRSYSAGEKFIHRRIEGLVGLCS
jgi:hypothetical protein